MKSVQKKNKFAKKEKKKLGNFIPLLSCLFGSLLGDCLIVEKLLEGKYKNKQTNNKIRN